MTHHGEQRNTGVARTVWASVGAAVVAAGSMIGLAATSAAEPQESGTVTVFVDATSAGFVDTGFTLQPGRPVVVVATGIARHDSELPSTESGPDGYWWICEDSGCPLPGAGFGSLIGKVGVEPPIFVGSGPTTVLGTGPLEFAYNDFPEFADNSGGYDVTITFSCDAQTGYPDAEGCGNPVPEPAPWWGSIDFGSLIN